MDISSTYPFGISNSRRDQNWIASQIINMSPFFEEALQCLLDLVKTNEPLDPFWRDVWPQMRQQCARYANPAIIEYLDSVLVEKEPDYDNFLPPDQRLCFLLGAGASADAPSSIPTVSNLLEEMWKRARKLGRGDLDRLCTWCNAARVTNIEELLTAAYISNYAATSSSVSGLINYFLFSDKEYESIGSRHRNPSRDAQSALKANAASVALFQETLQGLFGLLTSTMIPAPPNEGHKAIAEFVKRRRNVSIITTNYDGCLDEALQNAEVRMNSHLFSAGDSDAVDLIKVHGSINWAYCSSCHEVKEFDMKGIKENYQNDRYPYAVVGICRSCGGQRRPMLVPPIGLKFVIFPCLINLWNQARVCIESADIIIVVGYSFSEADAYINKVVERSMVSNAKQKLFVCDISSQLVPALQSKYDARVEQFDKDRIVWVRGSSSETMPRLLLGQKVKSVSGTTLKRHKYLRKTTNVPPALSEHINEK